MKMNEFMAGIVLQRVEDPAVQCCDKNKVALFVPESVTHGI